MAPHQPALAQFPLQQSTERKGAVGLAVNSDCSVAPCMAWRRHAVYTTYLDLPGLPYPKGLIHIHLNTSDVEGGEQPHNLHQAIIHPTSQGREDAHSFTHPPQHPGCSQPRPAPPPPAPGSSQSSPTPLSPHGAPGRP